VAFRVKAFWGENYPPTCVNG